MKTPRLPQDPLRTPLNAMLGTEANVRMLRVLALAGEPLGAGELARRARLGRATVYPALESLEKSRIVEFTGIGAHKQAVFRHGHPLGQPLIELFLTEERRVDALVRALRGVVKELRPRPTSAWLDGLTIDERREETLSLWLVTDPKSLSASTASVADAVQSVEQTYGVSFEIHGLTRSELEARAKTTEPRLTEAVLLAGVPPVALIPSKAQSRRTLKSHAEQDAGGRRLAAAIAAKLKWDPTLVRAAEAHIEERMRHASAGEQKELAEWGRVLRSMSPSELQRFLVDKSERATRLRQTLPALGLLTPVEREAVLASTSEREARSAVLGR